MTWLSELMVLLAFTPKTKTYIYTTQMEILTCQTEFSYLRYNLRRNVASISFTVQQHPQQQKLFIAAAAYKIRIYSTFRFRWFVVIFQFWEFFAPIENGTIRSHTFCVLPSVFQFSRLFSVTCSTFCIMLNINQ